VSRTRVKAATSLALAALVLLPAARVGADQPEPPPADSVQPEPPPPQPSTTARPKRALELHDEARALYAEGRYRDAITKLKEAVRLDPQAKLLYYNLGLIEERTGELAAALEHYRACLELEKDPEERDKLETIIKRIEGARAHEPSGPAPATSNTAPAPAPDPEPAHAPPSPSPWIWGGAALTVGALVVGAALATRASDLDPNDNVATSADVTLDDLQANAESAHDYAIGADIAFCVAGAAAVATVILVAVWIAGDDDDEPTLSWRF
jgi:tetratricopeptide (TPR) repeat protein